jgi:DNA-binding GntR family transcriptional regulator
MTKATKANTTLANAAYDRLRADLLSCRLAPGEPIKINELSVTLGTNPIAIREALSKLTSEGLVTSEAQKGFRAAPISAGQLRDLTRVRIEIECLCLKSAIANGDIVWETGIVGALHGLLRTPMRAAGDPQRNSDDWAASHARFHEALVKGCDSPLLLGFRATLFAQSERYRRLSVPLAEFDRDLDGEHRDIANAAVARDSEKAAMFMTVHLQTTANILLKSSFSKRELETAS